MDQIRNFSLLELIERRNIQVTLGETLSELRESLFHQKFNDAIILHLKATQLLHSLEEKNLALKDELEMADTLRENVKNIFRIQQRLQ